MSSEIEVVYEDGVLKPDKPLPFEEHERVIISFRRPEGRGSESQIRQSAGIIKWDGDPEALDYLLGPMNHPWAKT